jgi:hypothetical protein
MADNNTTDNTAVDEKTVFEKHYEELLPEIRAFDADKVVQVNLDIMQLVSTVLGSLPEIIAKEKEIRGQLAGFDIDRALRLEAYVMALSHAHRQWLNAVKPPDGLEALVEEATRLRENLFSDASALVQRKLMDGARLAELLGPIGYKNLASDLLVLSGMFREQYPKISGKCATQKAEIARADQLAADILRAVGLKEQGTALIAETTDIRNRAFTIVIELYDQARRAIQYLRWKEDDADTIAPSLFAARSARKRTETPKPPAPTPPVPPVTGGSPVTGTSPVAPPATAVTPVPADPFLS